ncbi:MAG: amino acid adenylation domain-containing protein [Phormidesmis sp.]
MSQFYQQLATLTPEQRALFEQKLAEKGLAAGMKKLGDHAIPKRPENQPIPLSFAQQRLWFVQQLDPANTAYNVASVLELEGPLDVSALEKSLNALIERHETFRTHFELTHCDLGGDAEGQTPIQVINSPQPIQLKVETLTLQKEPQVAAEERIQAIAQTPFDLGQPLLRTALLQVGRDRHLLVLATHHIISDRWSVMVFLREMTLLYRAFSQGQSSPLPPLAIQYADWAIWQRQQLQGEKLQQQIDYWKNQLSGELPVLDLPLDRPYSPVATYQGSQVPIVLSPELSKQLKALSGQYQVTLFVLLLAAAKVLLHRYTDSDDIVVGSDIANRDRTETEGLIGLLVNTLVFRSDLSNDPRFCDLLQQVRETVLSGLAHKDLPFEKLVEVINPERQLSQMMPLFQVKLDLQQVDVKPMQLDGLTLSRYPLPETQAKYELRFNLQDTPQGIGGQVEYNRDLFDESTIARLIEHFKMLLSEIVADPTQSISTLPLLSAKEQKTLLIDWNQTQRDYPSGCIHQLFEKQVERTPGAIALTDAQAALTYAELNARANRIAHYLRTLDIGTPTQSGTQTVGVCMERSGNMVACLLAILKAGAAYVPLDPTYPTERLAFIAEDADIQVILTHGQSVSFNAGQSVQIVDINNISQSLPTTKLEAHSVPKNLAYVIYTSGSTGKPKGVAIEHCNTVALLHWAKEQFSQAELSGVLASTSICFDLSIFEIFAPLSWGGCTIVVENALALSQISSPIEISLLNTVPSILTQLLKLGKLPESVATVNLAGEALPVSLVQQLQQLLHIKKIYNLYGPSEDTTYSTCAPLHGQIFTTADSRAPIGQPIANTQAYVLDRYCQPVPVGVAGELYLGGAGMAQGYLNRPRLTAGRFVNLDLLGFDSSLVYKTGDRVRYLPNGNLEFLGRFDDQIKIRGFRVETGEVEAFLHQHPFVKEAVVVVAWGETDRQLVAYIVLQDAAPDDSWQAEIRHDLAQQLPAYLIPTQWVALEALPQLPNGKIDRRSFPTPAAQTTCAYVAPQSELEKTIAAIWRDTLSQDKVGIHDNFFELGGHSLLAIQIVAQAESKLQRKLSLRDFFKAPTVADFTEQIEGKTETLSSQPTRSQRPQIEPSLAQRHQPIPLTDIQQAYWIGRSQAFELGNIGTHGYREIDVIGLFVEQVEQALNALIARHDMLRAVVNTDGQQMILSSVPHYKIEVNGSPAETKLEALRDRLSHQLFKPEQWPLFHIEAANLSDNKVRFFISFDVLIGDAWSFQLLGQEMAQLIRGDRLSPLSLSFRDYVVAEQVFQATSVYEQALEYWKNRLPTLPPAPNLPLTMAPSQVISPRFERRSGRLEAADWAKLKQRANQASLTPSGVVLAAFAEVLTTWSQQPQFTLNLTLFNRLPLHPEVNQIVGDFTASMLLAVDNSGSDTFANRAQRLQQQLWQDLDHRAVSGVRVLRELAKTLAQQSGGQKATGALMPVVFTSTLNQAIPQTHERNWQTETVFSVSQTSQVYLDHQVSEIAGALVFNWDAIADLFPKNLLDEMFSAYDQLLHQLAEDETIWQTLPQLAPTDYVQALNQTEKVFEQRDLCLQALFFEQVKQRPEHLAIIAPDRTLSYRELSDRTKALAQQLKRLNVRPNQLVAVSIEKGWQQVVAVLGILSAGAAYVPIDPTLPQERRWQLIEDTAAEIVLMASGDILDWPSGLTQIRIKKETVDRPEETTVESLQSPTDVAYVIYTSGSTGMPKGVMIDHKSVVNTILDINQRFEVGPSDRVFALSSLSFDLSVYDIFGTLAAGATLVMPSAEQEKNPAHWRSLLTKHKVTLWNSVPALMQLLTTELAGAKEKNNMLRLTLLSGDWIPLTLPAQIKQQFPTAKVISLGGATEASIWSIFYPIESVDPNWRSIPYGRPLANQQWYVLDENLTPCPPWVIGQLYISGQGIAKGYWNRQKLTSEQFIIPPRWLSEVGRKASPQEIDLYKTGDLGRYHSNGTLEFLGREDFQVKVNGYRIELGEIEHALQQHPAIESAVVESMGTPAELVAFIVPKLAAENSLTQPLAKLDFKRQQLGIRKSSPDSEVLHLPSSKASTNSFTRRQSHRQFLDKPINLGSFSDFLSELSAHAIADAPLPKYRYASAGSLYPIQTYLHIKANRVAGVLPGWYYYHPTHHTLVRLAPEDASPDAATAAESSALYGSNQPLHQDSAFSLFLVANMDAIEPIYGDKSRDFCLIETGYIGQLLMEKAPNFDLGLCPIGGFDAEAIRQKLGLGLQSKPLHALVGGAIAPSWNKQWMTLRNPSNTTLSLVHRLADRLKPYLETKLPSYLIPTRYQILSSLPLTANGKVDRRALPIPTLNTETEYVAPTTPTEKTITDLWHTLLEVEQVGIHDNFFELGGNSLTAMQLLSQLQNTFAIELTIGQLFGALTPALQAQLVEQVLPGAGNPQTNASSQGEESSQFTQAAIPRRQAQTATLSIDELSDENVDDLLEQLLASASQPDSREVSS